MLNWDAFANLPGGTEYNFEMLCRIIIHRNCGRFGHFAALASQPGVEFHLKLKTPCSLGDAGQWFGWQCRWYDLPSGRALGNARRNKIIEAITTTERVLPEITDWVLWTRHTLTEGDQKWFYSLKTHMKLLLWTTSEVEEYLNGEAEVFRGTFFGELILTPTSLSRIHELSVAPIKQKWQPELHQIIEAERTIRRMLVEPVYWKDLIDLADQISAAVRATEIDATDLLQSFRESLDELVRLGIDCATELTNAYSELNNGDIERIRERLSITPIGISKSVLNLPRRLRAGRHKSSMSATNLLTDVQTARKLLDRLNKDLYTQLIAVKADAGCGKTELAVQLTVEIIDRPSGILLHGRDLSSGDSLDDLAHRVVIQGKPVPSLEALLAAVDSAGRRAHRRLPVVIDGLNEAEDPRDWKRLLASLNEALLHYPYILFVCTLRTAFVEETLPKCADKLEIPDFKEDTIEAIRRYFKYYRINPVDASLPIKLLGHPLTLRLFCEVTNPLRDREVGIEAMPGSLTELFNRYLEQTSKRVAELAPRTRRLYDMDIRASFDEIGKALWEEKTRTLDLSSLRIRLNDERYSWGDSIVRALEQDGILLRDSKGKGATTSISVMYDLLAGHLIAESIIAQYGQNGFEAWLKSQTTIKWLGGSLPDRHPLFADIFRALVGLVPRYLHRKQLWQLLDGSMQTEALRRVADLEGKYIDAESVKQLRALILKSREDSEQLFQRLKQTRGAPDHPLNSEFLDDLLRPMSVSDRDTLWTEWTRRFRDDLFVDIKRLEKLWHDNPRRSFSDKQRARWVMWVLTSTVHKLRDQATRALYWFGRGDPSALFELTLDSLAINDIYVPERLLSASYGVVMAFQQYDEKFELAFTPFLSRIYSAMAGPIATHPTNHCLMRLYVQGMFTFAQVYYPMAVPTEVGVNSKIFFAPGKWVEPLNENDPKSLDVKHTLHIDFSNYTVGRLFEDRGNYNMGHMGYQAALAHIRGTIWNLGWRDAELGVIDQEVVKYYDRTDRSRIDRYGKKYSWIGYYTYAGILADQEKISAYNERLSDVDIDPSFPDEPLLIPIPLTNWAQPLPVKDENWLEEGKIEIPDEILYRSEIDSQQGPWVAAYGYLNTLKQTPGRQVYGFINSILVYEKNVDQLIRVFKSLEHPGSLRLSDIPGDYYTFAGEIPWSPNFAQGELNDNDVEQYYQELQVGKRKAIFVEMLAHKYAWESYHSSLNEAGGSIVPPRTFSRMFDLRGIPQSFSQKLPDGSYAALSYSAPSGFVGNLLYLREDLLHHYAAGRQLIWLVWGERELDPYPNPAPDWLLRVQRKGTDIWRYVRKGKELSRKFSS